MDISELISSNTETIDKQDILQLLQTGLKENQPFARYFAETVLSEIQRKIKDLKIQSTAIQIDGKSISEDIKKEIKSGLSKDLDKTVENIRQELKSSKKTNKKEEKDVISISSLLGQTPTLSASNQKKYQKITKELLDKITSALPKEIGFSKKGINISDVFSSPSAVNVTPVYQKKWNKFQIDLLNKVASGLPKEGFKFDEGITLSDVFQAPGDSKGFWSGYRTRVQTWNKFQIDLLNRVTKSVSKTKFKFDEDITLSDVFQAPDDSSGFRVGNKTRIRAWNKFQTDLLNKITKNISKTKFEFDKNVTLSDIMGETPQAGLFTRLKWARTRIDILNKIQKGLPEIALKKDLKLSDIMGETPQAGLFTRLKWGILQQNILKKIARSTAEDKKENKDKSTPDSSVKDKKGFRSLEEKENITILGGFTPKAIKELEKLLHGKGLKAEVIKKEEKKTSGLMDIVKNIKDFGSKMLSVVPALKSLASWGASQIGLKPLSAGAGAFATGIASAGTNLLLAKYAVDLGRMAMSKEYRAQKEKDVAAALDDPNRSALGKAVTGILNLPTVITGILSEKEKQEKLKEEGMIQEVEHKSKTEKMLKEKVGEERFKELKKMAMKDPALIKALQEGNASKYDEIYTKNLHKEFRKTLKETESADNKPKEVNKIPAQDFIWRKGQGIQPFSNKDNVIAVKDNKKFEKIISSLKDNSTQNNENLTKQINLLHTGITKLVTKMDAIINVIIKDQSSKQNIPAAMPGILPGISDDSGTIRDPAYVLRSRAWDRIRKGYVVL